jgi:hypothetical protein
MATALFHAAARDDVMNYIKNLYFMANALFL